MKIDGVLILEKKSTLNAANYGRAEISTTGLVGIDGGSKTIWTGPTALFWTCLAAGIGSVAYCGYKAKQAWNKTIPVPAKQDLKGQAVQIAANTIYQN